MGYVFYTIVLVSPVTPVENISKLDLKAAHSRLMAVGLMGHNHPSKILSQNYMERLYCLLVTAFLLLSRLYVISCPFIIILDAVAIMLCIYILLYHRQTSL